MEKDWEMHFDGVTQGLVGAKVNNENISLGIDIVFMTSDNGVMMHSLTLGKGFSNNEAKYEAHIIGLELDLEFPIEHLMVYGDSKLVV